MTEIVDTLVTQLEFGVDTKLLDRADKQLKKIEKSARATATATDVLADEQLELNKQLQVSAEKEQKLNKEQRKLQREIKATKGPTKNQRLALMRIDRALEDARESSLKYRNELKRLGFQQAKISRQSRREAKDIGKLSRARSGASARGAAAAAAEGPGGLAGVAAAAGPVGAALAGIATAGAAAAAAIAPIIHTGAEMEGLRARLKTVEGSVGKATIAFSLLRDIAKTTPFELQDVTTAYVRLKSLGIQPTEKSILAFGNVAAAQGKPLIDFVEAVGDAATGEFERLKEFGIKASSQGDKVAFNFAGVTTTVGKNAKEITKFLEGLGETQFAGAMADQMNTFNGIVSNLKDTWTGFLDQIAQLGVLDEAKLILKELSGTLEDGLAEVIAGVLIDGLRMLREFMVDLRERSGGLKNTLENLINVLKVLGAVMTPLLALWRATIAALQFAFEVVGSVAGAITELWGAVGSLWERLMKLLNLTGSLTEVITELWARLMNLLKPVEDMIGKWERLGAAWETAKGVGSTLLGAIDSVTAGLFNQAEAIEVVRGSIQDLQDQASKGKLGDLSDAELKKLIQEGSEEASAEASKEVRKRVKRREKEEVASEQAKKVAENSKKKDDAKKKREGRSGEVAKDFDDLSDRSLAIFASDPTVPKKLRDKAAKEQKKRAKKKSKKGAAAGKKARGATLVASIDKQIAKNARELAQAATARGLRSGELTSETAGAFETKRFQELKSKQQKQFRESGRLPAGIAQDVRQIAAIPSINDLGGRTQAPVISNTIIKVDVHGNTFKAEVTGEFATGPQEVVDLSVGQFDRAFKRALGEGIGNYRTTEIR